MEIEFKIVFAPLFLFSCHVLLILMSFSLIFLLKVQILDWGLSGLWWTTLENIQDELECLGSMDVRKTKLVF